MTSKERISQAIQHREADRVPYDLSGTTVTGICIGAFRNAMKERGLSVEYQKEVDPISQIVTPIEETLVALNSDTRRIGGMAGSVGGILIAWVAGMLFDHYKALGNIRTGYGIMFIICALAYLIAWFVMHFLVPRYKKIDNL